MSQPELRNCEMYRPKREAVKRFEELAETYDNLVYEITGYHDGEDKRVNVIVTDGHISQYAVDRFGLRFGHFHAVDGSITFEVID